MKITAVSDDLPLKKEKTKEKGNSKDKYAYKAIQPWIVPIIILIIWEVICLLGFVKPDMLPAPTQILSQFWTLIVNGELFVHFSISMQRVLIGFFIGSTIGLILGILTGFSTLIQKILDPSLQMLRTVPLLALIPLFILWFGVGEFAKVLMISLGAFFPVYLNTFLGIRMVDIKLYEVTKVLQFSALESFNKSCFTFCLT